MVNALVRAESVMLLCGRYEGIDERVIEAAGLEEVSLGDFVLAGGEVAAQALIEACTRLLPNVLGNAETLTEESFSQGLLEYPHYTRPPVWEGRAVPDVLISGDHKAVAAWRQTEAQRLTRERRSDLWQAYLQRMMKQEIKEKVS
jgi:tRNA (guanine37-N1)-methyltransferase